MKQNCASLMLFRLNRTKKLKKGPLLSVPSLACVASVSSRSRGSSRKLGQEQKKKWMTGEGAKPFFCFRSNFRAINRLETLATQAMPSQPASASVFNRVIAQKLEREHFIPLFLHLPRLSRRTCAEKLASQATDVPEIAVTNSSCAISFFPIAIHVTSGY